MSQWAASDPIFKVLRLDEAVPAADLHEGSGWDVRYPQTDDSYSTWPEYCFDDIAAMSMTMSAGSYFPMAGSLLLPDVLPSHAETLLMTSKHQQIKEQVEFYLSDVNLCQDQFFNAHLAEADEGWLDAQLVLDCPRMKRLDATEEDLFRALCDGGSVLEIAQWPSATCEMRLYIRRPGGAPPPPLTHLKAAPPVPAIHAATPRKADVLPSNMESPMSRRCSESATTATPNEACNDGELAVQDGSAVGSEDLHFEVFDSNSPDSSTAPLDASSAPFLLKLSEVLPLPFPPDEATPPSEESSAAERLRAGADLQKLLQAEPMKLTVPETIDASVEEVHQPDEHDANKKFDDDAEINATRPQATRGVGVKRAKNGQPRLLQRI